VYLLAALCGLASLAFGQPPAQPGIRGPWDHDLYLFTSEDGLEFGDNRLFINRAGVPCLARDAKGRILALFQWFPFDRKDAFDQIAVMISNDHGATWSKPQPIEVAELPQNQFRPADPTVVAVEDGNVRLYFTSLTQKETDPATYSAISADGVHYVFEPGRRFGVPGKAVLDCAVVQREKQWHYFAPVVGEQGKAYHAVSQDGLHFKRGKDVSLPGLREWLGCAVPVEQGIRFYGSGKDGVWSARSADGGQWALEPGVRAWGNDPGVVRTKDGRWLMLVTGPPRPDAGKARPPFLPVQPESGKDAGKKAGSGQGGG
jgi:hypothetical protein